MLLLLRLLLLKLFEYFLVYANALGKWNAVRHICLVGRLFWMCASAYGLELVKSPNDFPLISDDKRQKLPWKIFHFTKFMENCSSTNSFSKLMQKCNLAKPNSCPIKSSFFEVSVSMRNAASSSLDAYIRPSVNATYSTVCMFGQTLNLIELFVPYAHIMSIGPFVHLTVCVCGWK